MAAIAIMPISPVMRRLANSITPCSPISGDGTKDPATQLGQVGQPSPEPVRRTAPPVPTITISETSDSQATTRIRASTAPGNQVWIR
jgi:hypothetical protein